MLRRGMRHGHLVAFLLLGATAAMPASASAIAQIFGVVAPDQGKREQEEKKTLHRQCPAELATRIDLRRELN